MVHIAFSRTEAPGMTLAVLSCLSYHVGYEIWGRMGTSRISPCHGRRRNLHGKEGHECFPIDLTPGCSCFDECERVSRSRLTGEVLGFP